jgi:hypothetical protein
MEEHREELSNWLREHTEEIEITFDPGEEVTPLQQEQLPTMTAVTTTTVNIGGVNYTVNAAAMTMTTASMTVFTKENRASLYEEKRAERNSQTTNRQVQDAVFELDK